MTFIMTPKWPSKSSIQNHQAKSFENLLFWKALFWIWFSKDFHVWFCLTSRTLLHLHDDGITLKINGITLKIVLKIIAHISKIIRQEASFGLQFWMTDRNSRPKSYPKLYVNYSWDYGPYLLVQIKNGHFVCVSAYLSNKNNILQNR